MKNLSIMLGCFAISIAGISQSIGIGTNNPHPSAQLDVTNTTKGILPPRMTTAQRNAIASPAKGMLVYDTDASLLYHHSGSGWVAVGNLNIPFSLPFTGSISVQGGTVFEITNTGDGKAIAANKSGALNAAIEGRAEGQFGIGAKGNNTGASGYGVYGTNPTGTAVAGTSTGSGTAMEAIADDLFSKALLTNGNLRFFNGFQDPTAGAVLTASGTEGNAFWVSRPKVAFKLNGIYFDQRLYYSGIAQEVRFKSEEYDLAGNIVPTPESGATFYLAENTFTVPVDGIYAFDYALGVETTVSNTFTNAALTLVNDPIQGNEYVIDKSEFINRTLSGQWPAANKLWLHGSTQVRLKTGDKVFLRFQPYFVNLGTTPVCAARYQEDINYFSGRLVVRL